MSNLEPGLSANQATILVAQVGCKMSNYNKLNAECLAYYLCRRIHRIATLRHVIIINSLSFSFFQVLLVVYPSKVYE